MSHPLFPPVFRGKIPTTPGRLLAAAGVMFLLDLPLFVALGAGVFMQHFTQVMLMIGVLLLSSRRWIAATLLLLVSAAYFARHGLPMSVADGGNVAAFLIPLWVGVLVAYPRPRQVRKA